MEAAVSLPQPTASQTGKPEAAVEQSCVRPFNQTIDREAIKFEPVSKLLIQQAHLVAEGLKREWESGTFEKARARDRKETPVATTVPYERFKPVLEKVIAKVVAPPEQLEAVAREQLVA